MCLSTMAYAQNSKPVAVEPGVSYNLAVYRHSVISSIQYTLSFDIPAEKSKEMPLKISALI
jgi:aminopeptidase N